MYRVNRFCLIAIFLILIVASIISSYIFNKSNEQWWSNLLLNFAASLFVSILVISLLNLQQFFKNRNRNELLEYEECLDMYDAKFVTGLSRFRDAKGENSGYWMYSFFGYFFEKYEMFLNVCKYELNENKHVRNQMEELMREYHEEKENIDRLYKEAVRQVKENGIISSEVTEKMESLIMKFFKKHTERTMEVIRQRNKDAQEVRKINLLE